MSLIWDDKGVIFVIRNLRLSSGAQSVASLMNAVASMGRNIYLVTQSEPSGDDFVSNDAVKRFAVDVLETRGYTTEESFFKIISEIPVRTIVFAGDINRKTIQLFQTAEKTGRCLIFASDRSPFAYLASGSEKLSADCLYMLQNSDCVITPSETDTKSIEQLGAKKAVFLPFYFPYFEKEVSPAKFAGGRIVFYTTYAGRNTRGVITALARLHEKHPEITAKVVIYTGVKTSPVRESLISDIENSVLSDFITVEYDLLKPMRALREADISVTYSHPIYMTETVMESIAAGIPALNLQDGAYSGDSSPAININASDDVTIEKQLEHYLNIDNALEYQKRVRQVLNVEYRQALAEKWANAIDEALKCHNALVEKKSSEFESIRIKAAELLKSGATAAQCVKKLICEYASASDIFAALILAGVSPSNAAEAFNSADLFGQGDYNKYFKKLPLINACERYLKAEKTDKLSENAVFYLASAGADIDRLTESAVGFCIDGQQARFVLSRFIKIEKGLSDIRLPNTEESAALALSSPEYCNLLTSYKSFALINAYLFKNKGFGLLNRAIAFLNWYTAPFSEHGVLGKLFLLPSRVISVTKKTIINAGRRRLAKRKVTEVEPADVRKIQLMVLQLMLEFERICKKHNLRYYLAGGTILGGIRHKGFIPWDDDMDITMPRPDYEKFLKIAKKELSDEYKIDKDCVPFCHNRIEFRNSKFDSFWRDGGIFLDILALDGSPDDEKTWHKHERKTKYWRTWMLEKARPLPVLTSQREVQHLYLKRLVARLIPRKFLKWRWHSWAARYSCADTQNWVCLPASIYTYEQERFPKEYWGEPVMMEFEGHMMPTMSHWEDYLVCHFGDYMKMPPETLRKSHHFIYEYDLGDYKNVSVTELEKKLETGK